MKPQNFVIFRSLTIFMSIAVAITATNLHAKTRTWTDKTGKFKVQAELVEGGNGVAKLQRKDGSIIEVPLEKLSKADQRWIEKNQEKDEAAEDQELTTALANVNADSRDWPRWRGPNNDGISTETGLLKIWPEGGPPLVWSGSGLGSGYSSVAVANGKIYTMGNRDGGTKLICLSAEDGSKNWETPVGGGADPNCSPTVDTEANLVFGLSHAGDLLCADADTGKEVWRKNFGRDFGGRMMSGWGYSESPLVDGDHLIVTPGSDRAVMAALNKKTGDIVWTSAMPEGSAGYSSPVISNGGGVKQYVTLVGKGLIGVAADDGRLLWHYKRIANGTANVPTPLVQDDYVFGSSGYGDGGSALLRLRKSGRNGVEFQEVYYKKSNELQNHHGGMVLIGDYVYMGHGHNNGLPVCFELKTGKVKWGPERGPGNNSAALVAADGNLYFRYQDGIMGLVEATPKGYELKGSFKIKTRNGESWPHPVIASKKLYLRDQDVLHCYDISAQ